MLIAPIDVLRALSGQPTAPGADRIVFMVRLPRVVLAMLVGGRLARGENRVHEWMPGLEWEPRPTNFWWWRTGEDPGVRVRAPRHSIWRFLTARDVTWPYHGLLHVTARVTPLAVLEEEGREAGVLLYEDGATTAGRVGVTTLDPIYHHGSNVMPAASDFLRGLLHWVGGEPAPARS